MQPLIDNNFGFDRLPTEIWQVIAAELKDEALSNARLVCRGFALAIDSQSILIRKICSFIFQLQKESFEQRKGYWDQSLQQGQQFRNLKKAIFYGYFMGKDRFTLSAEPRMTKMADWTTKVTLGQLEEIYDDPNPTRSYAPATVGAYFRFKKPIQLLDIDIREDLSPCIKICLERAHHLALHALKRTHAQEPSFRGYVSNNLLRIAGEYMINLFSLFNSSENQNT